MALFWSFVFEGAAPDIFDITGTIVAIVGVIIIFYAPRRGDRVALLEYLAYFEMNPDIFIDDENSLPSLALNPERDEELSVRIIIRLAKLLAHLRAVVPTWETRDTQGSEYAYTFAKIEDPSRAITQLRNLARGHTISKARGYITEDDLPVVIHTALSTASIERVRIFELLLVNNGQLTTTQIIKFLNITRPTALRTMTELKAIGLVDLTSDTDEHNTPYEIILRPEFDWFLSDKFAELRGYKEKIPPREPSCDEPIKEVGHKENYPPTTPPLFLYDYNINKKLNLSWKDSLYQNDRVRGVQFSLHQDTGEEKAFDQTSQGHGTDITQRMVLEYEPKGLSQSGAVSSTSEEKPTYPCVYCRISGNTNTTFDALGLYERHIVNKHSGHTAYPGPGDLKKFQHDLNSKKQES